MAIASDKAITECDRLWMQVLAARAARIRAQKQETDAIDRFSRAAKAAAIAGDVTAHVWGVRVS